MMTRAIATGLMAACAAAYSGACSRGAPAPATSTQQTDTIERGRYLVTAMGCNDCHTPFKMGANGPEPDMNRMLSGHPAALELPPPPPLTIEGWAWAGSATNTAFAGPWGVSYAINLTPDAATGLGPWTETMFIQSMRTGKHMGVSRPVQPPMPWPWYGKLSDADLRAVFTYLRSIPPIANRAPAWKPPAK
jgi:Cytochrome c